MVNEVLQWAILVILSTLILGILRQVALTLPPEARSATPSGPTVGRRLPQPLLTELERALPGGRLEDDILVAFVTERCPGCQRLLGSLTSGEARESHPLILVAKRPSSQFTKALSETGVPTVLDEKGALWEASEVRATPLVVRLDSHGRVTGKEVTHHVDRVAVAAT
jgi:hypothetical protein